MKGEKLVNEWLSLLASGSMELKEQLSKQSQVFQTWPSHQEGGQIEYRCRRPNGSEDGDVR